MKMINIDGPDGSGKTTLIDGLLDTYSKQGYKVDFLHFPRYDTELGKVIKKALLKEIDMPIDAFQMLCSADRRSWSETAQETHGHIDILFVDRHSTSAIVYGSGVSGVALDQILSNDRDVLQPDLHIILECSAQVCIDRMSDRGDDEKRTRYENWWAINVANQCFQGLKLIYDNLKYVNAEHAESIVLQEVVKIIDALLFYSKGKPLQ